MSSILHLLVSTCACVGLCVCLCASVCVCVQLHRKFILFIQSCNNVTTKNGNEMRLSARKVYFLCMKFKENMR